MHHHVHRLNPMVEQEMSGCGESKNGGNHGLGGSGSSPSPVDLIRAEMLKEGLDGYIIGSSDSHMSEYVCDRDRRLAFISGFTGSFGLVIITSKAAFLWTDGRYFLQASQELSEQWTLMKMGEPNVPTLIEWLALPHEDILPNEAKFGVDPTLISMSMGDKCKTSLEKAGRVLKCLRRNLVDAVWSNPPPSPCAPMRVHPLKYAGKSSKEKLSDLRSSLKSQKANAQLVCALDEVAWLLNIRGNDIPNTPVTIAYLLVLASEDIGGDDGSSCILFVDENKLTNDVSEHLPSEVSVQPYCQILEVFEDVVKMLEYPPPSSSSSSSAAAATEEHGAGSGGVLIDQGQMNLTMGNIVPEDKRVYQSSSITLMKALKNEAELKGMRDCHVRDGAALCAFLAWLDEAVHLAEKEGGGVGLLTEDSVCYKLESYRKAQPGFVGPSFPTIAGFGPNGAVIHYKPTPESALSLDTSSMFLLDSGGQYEDGTTDITRTVHWGTPTDYQIRCFTLVLKGHASLAMATFPDKVPGSQLDTLARVPLWKEGLDYRHGTGHGVGAALGVHEGPQNIGRPRAIEETGFQIGMTSSNEPGYYEDGSFGIRIENVCEVVKSATPHSFGGKDYLWLRTISLAPIQRSLTDVNLLTDDELHWLNQYHEEVKDKLTPLLENDPRAYRYLLEHTAPIWRS